MLARVIWPMSLGMIGMLACAAAAQEKGQPKEKEPPPAGGGHISDQGNKKTMEQLWAEAAVPGVAHKVLDFMVGEFDVTCKTWDSASSEPVISKAHSKGEWVLDGRFVKTDFSGELGGKPLSGIGYVGFDNIDMRFTSVWMDNASTSASFDRGFYDPVAKQIKFEGEIGMPSGGVIKTRTLIIPLENGAYSIVIYHNFPDRPEYKAMQLDYQLLYSAEPPKSEAPTTAKP